jgi:hypothetical protein
LLPGPGAPDHDAALATKMARFERQLHGIMTVPLGWGLEAGLAEHVQLQGLFDADPVVLAAQVVQLGSTPSSLVAFEHEAEQGHEVGLAGAEAAVEVAGLAAVVSHGAADETEGLVEGVERWKFPKPPGGGSVKVTYPFVLSPG